MRTLAALSMSSAVMATSFTVSAPSWADGFSPARDAAIVSADPWTLFTHGHYAWAADVAAAQDDDPDTLVLAARAVAAEALLSGRTDPDAGHRVRALAEAALALDPDHVDAQLQLAVGLWLEGRETSAWRSFWLDLPGQGREALTRVLRQSPNHAWAHALMGAWHLEVLRRGGERGARHYGADLHAGVASFYRAMRLDPDNAAISLQCAVSLLALDAETYRAHAEAALALALDADADDAFEAALIRRAERLAALLDAEESDGLRQELASWTQG